MLKQSFFVFLLMVLICNVVTAEDNLEGNKKTNLRSSSWESQHHF